MRGFGSVVAIDWTKVPPDRTGGSRDTNATDERRWLVLAIPSVYAQSGWVLLYLSGNPTISTWTNLNSWRLIEKVDA